LLERQIDGAGDVRVRVFLRRKDVDDLRALV
jgi:hypothetical protein